MRPEEREAIRHALLAPDRPTGVFAMNDLLAAELVRLAQGEGLEVPGDLSIVGFDGLERTALVSQLTTVRQPAEEVGLMAVRILAERLNGKRTGPGQTTTLRVELLEGATVAPPCPSAELHRSDGTAMVHGSGPVGSLRPLPFHD
jgi:LacI family transcriptional regulator